MSRRIAIWRRDSPEKSISGTSSHSASYAHSVGNMPLVFDAPSDTPVVEEIEAVAAGFSDAFDGVALSLGIEIGSTRLILATDFEAEVNATNQEIAHQNSQHRPPHFSTERLGGIVAGKTLAHDLSYRDASILVASTLIKWEERTAFAMGVGLLAHELAHVLVGRARWASGALVGVEFPSITGAECARSIARVASEEYRVTLLANIALGNVVSIQIDNAATRPVTVHDVMGDGYTDQLAKVVGETVHPGWPSSVDKYRNHHMTLEQLSAKIISETEQVFTILGHAEAHALAGNQLRPLDAIGDQCGTDLYLRPAWDQLLTPVQATSPVPSTLEDVLSLEQAIASEGEIAIRSMWSKIGLTVEEKGNREWALWVGEPEY